MAPPPAARPERLRKVRRSMVAARTLAAVAETTAGAAAGRGEDFAFLVSMVRSRSDPRRAVVIADMGDFGVAPRLFLIADRSDDRLGSVLAKPRGHDGDGTGTADSGGQQEAAALEVFWFVVVHGSPPHKTGLQHLERQAFD